MAVLVMEQCGTSVQHELREGTILVGRLTASDIQINDKTVSGRHAQITVDANGVFLEDLGSRNGTRVNGQTVTARVQLTHGDQIEFSGVPYRFEDQPDTGRQAQDLRATPPAVEITQPVPNVQIADAADDASRIMDSSKSGSRFDALDVNPEAKLKAVLDLSTRLVGSVDLDSQLPAILDTLFSVFKYADRGCILLKDEATGQLIPRAFKHRRADQDATVRLSRAVVNRVLEQKEGILSADASTDDKFMGSESISELKIRSMMCVPLVDLAGEPNGIISIDSQNPLGQFTHEDLDLLSVVAGQASLSRERRASCSRTWRKKSKTTSYRLHGIFNTRCCRPPCRLWKATSSSPATNRRRPLVAITMIAWCCRIGKSPYRLATWRAKGSRATLIMSRISSCVQNTLRHVCDVEAAMLSINEHMCDSAVEGRFVTYVLAIVDTVKHTVRLSNAGHMPPIIRRADGTVEHFDDDELVGPPIGVVEDFPYEVETCALEPGDMIVIVTDGVDEAMNPDGEMYGTERTYELIRTGPTKAEEFGRALLADVRQHAAGRAQNDDITIFAFGRTRT